MMIAELKTRAEKARRICQMHGISQADIAAHVGASQSQVSRILSGGSTRMSRLFEEVCLFVERFEEGVTPELIRANPDLIDALQVTWDGSASHAKALASVIRSLAVLKPTTGT
ncbi:transcriptional regulator with XRE-family HTH domain [Acidovorax soli]|uniref:Transcriptional regulator with XRE-family HTH domain n=1 Tax=Acidovorax soli TaxID=592050 RepID=A0A7X0U8S3_9BURK|nr:helix-turn-helix transcriptional regulator [Acidovorax soli]MBB6559273.1 transcriptional regulator with XRE-family HTH domain [Acidovorax soli]